VGLYNRYMMKYKCKRCLHKWTPRQSEPPKQCPLCHSPYWDRERRIVGETQIRRMLKEVAKLKLWTEADKFFGAKQVKSDSKGKGGKENG
jgi:hypothetical protein